MQSRIVCHPPSKATNGTYIITVSYYVGNVRKQKRKSGFTRSKDAKAYGEEIKKKLLEEMPVIKATGGESISFEDLVDKIVELKKDKWSSNTLVVKKACLKHCTFKDTKINKIKKLDIEKNLVELQKTLKFNTVNSINGSYNYFLNAAVEYSLLISAPKVKLEKPKLDKKVKALSMDQVKKMMATIKDDRVYLLCLISSTCGLRMGEAIDLNLKDFDFKQGLLSVSHQYALHNGKRERNRPLKTSNSYRTIPVPQSTLNAIKAYPIKGIGGELFTDLTAILWQVNKFFLKSDYGITFHGLRHTYVTNLIASNQFDIQSIAKMTGDTVDTILKVYSHYLEKTQEENIKKINSLFS